MDDPKTIDNQDFQKIDVKIKELEREHSRPGWNIWLVATALFGICWLFLDRLEQFRGSWQLVGTFTVAFYFIVRFSFMFMENSQLRFRETEYLHVQFTKSLFRFRKRVLSIDLLYSAIAFYLFNVVMVPGWTRFFGNFFLSIFVLFIVSGFIFSVVSLPLVVGTQKKQPGIVSAVIYVLLFGLPIAIGVSLLLHHMDSIALKLPEFRMALLITGAAILLYILVVLSKQNPLLSSLRELRNDIAFNTINSSDANKRLDLILLGFRLEQAVDKELSSVLKIIHKGTSLCDRMNKHLDLLATPPKNLLDEESKAIQDAAQDALHDCLSNLEDAVNSLEKAQRKLHYKLSVIGKQCQDQMELAELTEKVQNELEIFKKSVNLLSKREPEFKKASKVEKSDDQIKVQQLPES